jgi:hypothetical protein
MILGSDVRFEGCGTATAIARATPLKQNNNATPAILLMVMIFIRSSDNILANVENLNHVNVQ